LRLQDVGRQVLAERTLREAERRLAEQEAYLQALRDVTDGWRGARRSARCSRRCCVGRRHALGAEHGFVHLVGQGGGALVPHRTLGRFAELPPIVFKRGEGLAGAPGARRGRCASTTTSTGRAACAGSTSASCGPPWRRRWRRARRRSG
jgi:hypothetical protein